jgi:hypothetical protein
MTDLDAKALAQRTWELFTECRVNLGAVMKDMAVFAIAREDMGQVVGE